VRVPVVRVAVVSLGCCGRCCCSWFLTVTLLCYFLFLNTTLTDPPLQEVFSSCNMEQQLLVSPVLCIRVAVVVVVAHGFLKVALLCYSFVHNTTLTDKPLQEVFSSCEMDGTITSRVCCSMYSGCCGLLGLLWSLLCYSLCYNTTHTDTPLQKCLVVVRWMEQQLLLCVVLCIRVAVVSWGCCGRGCWCS